MVVTDVLAQDALCVSLIHDDHVVEALPPKGPDHSFAIRIGKGVENLKVHGDDGEPVSGPGLAEVVADEGAPFLATTAR